MGDLKTLAKSWPMVGSFCTVHGVFEMRELWVTYLRASGRPGALSSFRHAGLSVLANTLLGECLGKI